MYATWQVGKEKNLHENREGYHNFSASWRILLDKEYQGARDFLRVIHKLKTPISRLLTLSKDRYNMEVSSECAFAKKFFRPFDLEILCYVSKMSLVRKLLLTVFSFFVALTNANIRASPLRSEVGGFHWNFKNRLLETGVWSQMKWNARQVSARQIEDFKWTFIFWPWGEKPPKLLKYCQAIDASILHSHEFQLKN